MNDRELAYQMAQKHVREIRGFYIHLIVYVLVNILLFAINMLATPGVLWFFWPLGGWGLAVIINALAVFGKTRFWGASGKSAKSKT